jgi:endonuclease G
MARRRQSFNERDLDPLVNSSVRAFKRLDRQAQLAVIVVLLIAGVIAAIIYYRNQHHGATGPNQNPSAAIESPNMLLGNPSSATPDPTNADNYLMVKPYFVLSYNNSNGTPNWVSWRVNFSDLGTAPRKPVFDPDTTLPAGFKVVTHKDYSGSGFDRGHMCPHGDRAANEEMSFSTFVMTNIIPQAPSVNQKAWAQMESYCRQLVRQRQRLYIIAGPSGRGGKGSHGFAESVGGGGKVTVPAECWKVVVVVPDEGEDDMGKISMGTRVIAVIMPNDQEVVGEAWAPYRTSAAAIEQKTGYKFFDRVRPDIAAALRQKVDDVRIPPPRPLDHNGG